MGRPGFARFSPGNREFSEGRDAETLTATRLGIEGKLKLTIQSTSRCESMISTVRVIHRNVKNWSSGDICLRWTAVGMHETESRFGKVQARATAGSRTSPSRSSTT
jgi:hypothetical protein